LVFSPATSQMRNAKTFNPTRAWLVVDESPAFNADILVGDVILSIDGVAIGGMQSFSDTLRPRGGKLVSIAILRRGQRIEKEVQLNP
jgi:C-terminal processing protease CtpA/Prc